MSSTNSIVLISTVPMLWSCRTEQISSKDQLLSKGPRTVPSLTRLHISNDCVFPKGVLTMISAFSIQQIDQVH